MKTDDHVTGVEDHVTGVESILVDMGLKPLSSPASDSQLGPVLELLNTTWNGDTLLHVAAANGCSSLIPILMLYGADPVIRNQSGHTPYLVAVNKEVRDSFRRFMALHPMAYDYERAHVPSPLTPEMEAQRNKKEAEKRKEKKKARKQRKEVS